MEFVVIYRSKEDFTKNKLLIDADDWSELADQLRFLEDDTIQAKKRHIVLSVKRRDAHTSPIKRKQIT